MSSRLWTLADRFKYMAWVLKFPALLFLFLLVILAFTLSRFVAAYTLPDPKGLYSQRARPLDTATVTMRSVAGAADLYGGNAVVVNMVVTALLPQTRTIEVAAQVGLGQQLQDNLVNLLGEPVLDPTTHQLKAKFGDLPAALAFFGNAPDSEVRADLTLNDLFAVSPQGEVPAAPFYGFNTKVFKVDLPASWLVERFPRDTLSSFGLIYVELPTLIVTRKDFACISRTPLSCGADISKIPLVVTAGLDDATATNGWLASVNQPTPTDLAPAGAPNFIPLELSFSREPSAVAYTFGIAAVPLFLFLLLYHTVWLRRKSMSVDGPAQLQNFVLSLAAAMLTVLPLRAVLVPQQVDGLTSVDYLPGAELLLLL